VDVSVNRTDCPGAGSQGLNVKDAFSPIVPTEIVRLALSDPEGSATVRMTVRSPVVAKMWVGFWSVLEPPSPKSHCQDVGWPEDVSVNWTDCPIVGEVGLKEKEALNVESDWFISAEHPPRIKTRLPKMSSAKAIVRNRNIVTI
jgi:hypothetical protein